MNEIGLRYNEGKLKWSLMDFEALEPMIQVLMFGAKKYDAHNWKKGLKYTEIIESLQRHMASFLRGEDLDPESNLPHVGHMQCNTLFLGYMYRFKKDFDDRYIDMQKLEILTGKINGKPFLEISA